jgi:hypothetical protein
MIGISHHPIVRTALTFTLALIISNIVSHAMIGGESLVFILEYGMQIGIG